MAMIIFPQFPPTCSFFKLFTLSLPFFCLLLTWGASSSTTPPPPLPALLHSSGYSLFATALTAATATNSFNFTGTILAPPDFTFSKFYHHRPTTSLLLYHTLNKPLTWQNLLLSRYHNHPELPTLYNHHCLFLSKKTNSRISFTSSRNSISAVNIRHPDLYVDDHLIVHGIDGVLDPSSATKCSVFSNPTAHIKLQIDRSLLDLAIRALKRKGFSVVATAMAIKSSDLMYFDSVTVFAPSDVKLFSFPNGFRYDFRHHVVQNRLRFSDIAELPAETEMETIDPEKTLVIGSVNGNVTINGAKIYSTEIYLNRWISVISISQTFDDESDNEANRQIVYPGVPSMAPIYSTIGSEDSGIAVPSTAPSYSGDLEESSNATELLDPEIERMLDKLRRYSGESLEESENTTGVPVPTTSGITDCLPDLKDGVVSVDAVEVGGGEVVCPVTEPSRLNESEALINVDAVPSDVYNVSSEGAPISAVDEVWE